jgi:hypothetical protein
MNQPIDRLSRPRPWGWLLLALGLCLPLAAQARGQKFAVLIGINEYANPSMNLEGSVNDATNMQALLTRDFGFAPSNVILLTNQQATGRGIIQALVQMRQRVTAGDLFVFYYSGHGTLFPDAKSEEHDEAEALPEMRFPNGKMLPAGKYDSAIVPHDAAQNGVILDDDFFRVFSAFTNAGCSVVLLSDSCNSGSLGRDLTEKARTVSPEEALGKPLDKIPAPPTTREVKSRDLRGKYLAITSSRDTQLSLEAAIDNGKRAGFFTYAFRVAVEAAKEKGLKDKLTYRLLFDFVHEGVLRLSRNRQEPQLDTRYYGGSLDAPLFAVDAAPPNNTLVRVVVKVTETTGAPLQDCAFVVFKPGIVPPPQGQITKEHALIIGRTDSRGLYSSQDDKTLIPPGTYRVKVVRKGYQSFEGEVPVRAGREAGTAVLAVQLKRE